MFMSFDSASLLEIYFVNTFVHVQNDVYTRLFNTALFIIAKYK